MDHGGGVTIYIYIYIYIYITIVIIKEPPKLYSNY